MPRKKGDQVGTYGAGSLREVRPGVFKYRARINGKQISKQLGSSIDPLTRKQAERRARAAFAEMANPSQSVAPTPDTRSFGDVLTEWLAYGRSTRGRAWSPKTKHENDREVRARIRPVLGDYLLADLTPAVLEDAYAEWSKDLADATVHRIAATVSTALKFAVRRGYIDTSPTARAVAPSASKTRKLVIPTPIQIRALIEAGEHFEHDMGKAITLGALTGARAGEVVALQWADVDLAAGTVRIAKAATAPTQAVTIKATKTATVRTVKLAGANRVLLRQQLGKPGPAHSYIIDGGDEPIRPAILTDRFTKVRKLAKIKPGTTFHGLRHAWATTLLAAGLPLHDVAALGGWRSVAMVASVYGHATPTAADRAAKVPMVAAS